MASSRKPAHKADPAAPDLRDPTATLTDKVAQALQAGAAFVVSGAGQHGPRAVAVALSGGRDSVALLHATRAALAATRVGEAGPAPLLALHVHHGLQAQADEWDRFCAGLCQDWRVEYRAARVTVVPAHGEGLEAAARRVRYQALTELCEQHNVGWLLFGHHLDDQVETVLMRLFRGSGVHGLAGMPALRRLAERRDIALLRPWLEIERRDIEAYCDAHGLRWIDDPSNDDTRFARNALRQQLPGLLAAFPALRANVAQAAAHLAEAAHALDALAARHLATLAHPGRDAATLAELDLDGLRALPAAQGDAVLRLWLRDLGVRAPSVARLAAMRAQLIDHRGGEPALPHDGLVLRRFRSRVLACMPPGAPPTEAVALQWGGQGRLPVPAWRGELRFTRDDTFGVPEAVLRQPLTLGPRTGGERIVLRPGGPARALKQAYQEAAVPAWRRPYLPLLRAGEAGGTGEQIVLAAGLGMHRRWPDAAPAPRWRVEWQAWGPDAAGLPQ
ncbi:tRNA lysidine(34) synthetase TilS [Cupriavidus cauae]|uniref:tRNA lysidine(34) synthetase TilS n=1 Tax=Cupriavidus cauae TaxID=2608999 RepID=UPI0038990A39|nr:tRNA lysidine(34) synthetase TilS [Cupriavidus cauae]